MSKLLYIQASPRGKHSHCIAVADAFITAYKYHHPHDDIITLNVFQTPLVPFDGLTVQAKYAIMHDITPSKEEQEAFSAVEKLISQFTACDKFVLAVPMWNFNIPYRLKQYIDIIVQPGYTFSFDPDQGYKGLVTDKPLLAVYSRGGEYPPGAPAEAFDLQKKYIELIFSFIGFENIQSVIVEPTLQQGPDVASQKRQDAVAKAEKIAPTF